MADDKSDANPLLSLVYRLLPGIGLGGLAILERASQWFGWFAVDGYAKRLGRAGVDVIGNAPASHYDAMRAEGFLRAIAAIVDDRWIYAGALVWLAAVLFGVSFDPERQGADQKWQRYYYVLVVVGAVAHLGLFLMVPTVTISLLAMAGLVIGTPVYAIQHGKALAAGGPLRTGTYLSLLLVMSAALFAYPFRYGLVLYQPKYYVVDIVKDKVNSRRFSMQLDPPWLAAQFHCANSKPVLTWSENQKPESFVAKFDDGWASLKLEYTCQGDYIVPVNRHDPIEGVFAP